MRWVADRGGESRETRAPGLRTSGGRRSQLPGVLLGPVPAISPRHDDDTRSFQTSEEREGEDEDPYHVTRSSQVAADLRGA
ncbi:hypothetical protein LEMLEM_LOCUS16236 [Lemmus lemmus]